MEINIFVRKGFFRTIEEKHRPGLVTKEIWLCIRMNTKTFLTNYVFNNFSGKIAGLVANITRNIFALSLQIKTSQSKLQLIVICNNLTFLKIEGNVK